MQRVPVNSSDVVSIGYDAPNQLLEVEFKGGRVYRYRNVEPELHAQFMRAESHGQFLFAYINGHYRYEKVAEAADYKPKSVALVSGNPRKLQFLQAACTPFKLQVERVELPVNEIQSDDPQEIALKKAKQAYRLARRPVLVNDAHWNILALRGFPGAYMSAVSQWLKTGDFLKLLEGKGDRSVYLTDTVAFYDGRRSKVFQKQHAGALTETPRGQGSPIEQLAVFAGQTQTAAELFAAGQPHLPLAETVWQDAAKWLHVQKRLGLLQ